MSAHQNDPDLEARRRELIREIELRGPGSRGPQPRGPVGEPALEWNLGQGPRGRRGWFGRAGSAGRAGRAGQPGSDDQTGPRAGRRFGASLSALRMRTLVLPAFAILLFVHFGSRAGAPLGVHAAFTPSEDGVSFAGPRVFQPELDGADAEQDVRLSPGDVIGTRSGSPSVLRLGDGRLELSEGARAAVASLLPPRARLIGGEARAFGRIRVVTVMGIVDLHEGEALLSLAASGLEVRLVSGAGELVAPAGKTILTPGELAASR